MNKTYIVGTLDFSQKKVVGSDPRKRISELKIHIEKLHQEIEFWYSHLLNSSIPQHNLYFRKPICIGLFEYAQYMRWLQSDIGKIYGHVKQIFKEKDRSLPITPLDGNVKNTINRIIKYLREPRTQFAAHHYTKNKSKNFITIGDVNSLLFKIPDKKLIEIRDQLFTCDELISLWINNNKNYLFFAGKD